MAKLEYKGSLDNINCCFICGERNEKLLNIDHRIPQALVTLPEEHQIIVPGFNMYQAHPMWDVVYSKSNLYKVCVPHHQHDKEKLSHFLGMWRFGSDTLNAEKDAYLRSPNRGEPALLMKWLIKRYPWSRNPYYFDMQRELTIISDRLFIEGVRKAAILVERHKQHPLAPSPFDEELLAKYQHAASIVEKDLIEVKLKPSPPLIGFIDFGRFTPVDKETKLAA